MGWFKEAAEAYATSLRMKDELTYGAFAMTGSDGKQSKKAIQALKQAIQVRPHDAKLYHQLGALYVQLNLDANALEVLKHAVRLNRQNAASWTLLGHVAARLGRHDEAWQAWREVIRLNPNDIDAQANLGGAYGQLGRFKEAQQICEKALQAVPNHSVALAHLGVALAGLNDYVGAERVYLRALQTHPTAVTLCNLGKVYTAIFHHDKAVAVYRRATQLASKNIEARLGLGLSYARLGKFSNALQQVDMLRDIDKLKAAELTAQIRKLADKSPS
jgi:tetratricopeptide (TPR) repeat protein